MAVGQARGVKLGKKPVFGCVQPVCVSDLCTPRHLPVPQGQVTCWGACWVQLATCEIDAEHPLHDCLALLLHASAQ